MELHHIDGNHTNNLFSNLVLLCPNCQAQTDNYRSKNLSARKEIFEVESRKFREASTVAAGNPEPSPDREGAETRHENPKS